MRIATAVELFNSGEMTASQRLEVARLFVTTGLVNSRGEYGRFVDDVINDESPENFYMDGELFQG